jgi:transcription elongation factor Elf1
LEPLETACPYCHKHQTLAIHLREGLSTVMHECYVCGKRYIVKFKVTIDHQVTEIGGARENETV